MTSYPDSNYNGITNLDRENALGDRQTLPVKTAYIWKDVFGDTGDENPTSDQTREINPTQFLVPEVDADEFESVYLWFLA